MGRPKKFLDRRNPRIKRKKLSRETEKPSRETKNVRIELVRIPDRTWKKIFPSSTIFIRLIDGEFAVERKAAQLGRTGSKPSNNETALV